LVPNAWTSPPERRNKDFERLGVVVAAMGLARVFAAMTLGRVPRSVRAAGEPGQGVQHVGGRSGRLGRGQAQPPRGWLTPVTWCPSARHRDAARTPWPLKVQVGAVCVLDRAEGFSMSPPTAPSRSTDIPGRALAGLGSAAVALAVSFVVAPGMLASRSGDGFADERILVESLREGFIGYWRSGDRDFSSNLQKVVDYWSRYHVVKAVIAAILLFVLSALGLLIWKAFLRAGGLGAGRRAALAVTGALVTMLALLSLVTVMANVQGAIAPFSSLLPMLEVNATGGELGDTLDQVRQRLADSTGTGERTPPALEVMISDFSRYHEALAVVAVFVAVGFIGMSFMLWRRFAKTAASERRTRRVYGSFGLLTTMLSLAVMVLVVANVTTAAEPQPALLAFFNGGW
jgi:hypothetical protein